MLAAAVESGELDSVLETLEVALQTYTESREFASTCPTCSLHLANMMLNYQYWKSEGEMGKESVSPEQSFFTSRPQVILLLHPTCGFVSHTIPHRTAPHRTTPRPLAMQRTAPHHPPSPSLSGTWFDHALIMHAGGLRVALNGS
jgi:hypothetical protein